VFLLSLCHVLALLVYLSDLFLQTNRFVNLQTISLGQQILWLSIKGLKTIVLLLSGHLLLNCLLLFLYFLGIWCITLTLLEKLVHLLLVILLWLLSLRLLLWLLLWLLLLLLHLLDLDLSRRLLELSLSLFHLLLFLEKIFLSLHPCLLLLHNLLLYLSNLNFLLLFLLGFQHSSLLLFLLF